MLHGFLGTGKNLRALALRWLAKDPDRRFWLPDLTGHGASPPLPPGADLDVIARDVLAGTTAAGLNGPIALVGHSLGGRVALAAARAAPDQISEVVLLDISPGPADPAAQSRAETRSVVDILVDAPAEAAARREMGAFLLGRGLSSGLVDWLLMNLRTRDDGRYEWAIDRRALEALHGVSLGEDLWSVVEGRSVPVRCIAGGKSAYVDAEDAARMKAAGCPVDVLPGAGHYVHVDDLDGLILLLTSSG